MDLSGSCNMGLVPDGSSKRSRSCGVKFSSIVLGSVDLVHLGNRRLIGDNGAALGFVLSDGKQAVG